MNQINVNPGQVQAAAAAGVKLLNDDERVNVPPSMAANGMFALLVNILNALASGEAMMANPPKEGDQMIPGSPELQKAVGDALKPEGNGAGEEPPAKE